MIVDKKIKKIINTIFEDWIRIAAVILFLIVPFLVSNILEEGYDKKIKLSALEKEIRMYPKNSFDGNSFLTDVYPIFNDVMFIGDSYSHFLSMDLGFDFTNFSCPGLKLEFLDFVFNAAMKVNKKYVVIFIGPNDFRAETKPEQFYNILNSYVSDIKNKMGATIILSRYLDSNFTNALEKENVFKYTVKEYNDEILNVVNSYDDVYYFDIDYHDAEKFSRNDEIETDYIHFNKEFNIIYMNELYNLLIDIERKKILG